MKTKHKTDSTEEKNLMRNKVAQKLVENIWTLVWNLNFIKRACIVPLQNENVQVSRLKTQVHFKMWLFSLWNFHRTFGIVFTFHMLSIWNNVHTKKAVQSMNRLLCACMQLLVCRPNFLLFIHFSWKAFEILNSNSTFCYFCYFFFSILMDCLCRKLSTC